MQMAAVVKRDLGIAFAGLVDFTGDVIFSVPGRHQHAWHHCDNIRAALDAAIEAVLNDRLGEFEKTAFHNARGVSIRKELNQLMKFRCAVHIPTAVARDQDRWFHEYWSLFGVAPSVLRSVGST